MTAPTPHRLSGEGITRPLSMEPNKRCIFLLINQDSLSGKRKEGRNADRGDPLHFIKIQLTSRFIGIIK